MMEKIRIPAQPGLDPIDVYFEDLAPSAGRVILICYDMAWTGYWGSIGLDTIKQFFLGCDAGYLFGNIGSGLQYTRGKADDAYLLRIIKAAQDGMKETQ